MGSKFTPLIIVVLLLIIVAVGFLAFNLLKTDKTDNNNVLEQSVAKPVVNISTEVDEEKHESVKIIVEAYTDDGTPIKEIVLPDGSTVAYENSNLEFTAMQNGEYEFTVVAENGQSTTEKITITEINEISATNPYIPEGFTHLGGVAESGYVIEDEYGNQYVWVPVESGKLTRNTMLETEYEESSTAATELVNSVAKYYGFYIARFEASQYEINGNIVAATMPGKTPWTNINCQDALAKAKSSANDFGYTDCSTALVSSYAWDTTLAWIDTRITNYSSNTNYGNYSGTVYPTGHTAEDNINNICDLAGNVREWTTEIYKPDESTTNNNKNKKKTDTTENVIYRVVRGGSANLNRTPGAHIGYDEATSDDYWGFRTVLYK